MHFNDVYNIQAAKHEKMCGGAARFTSLLNSFGKGGSNYDDAGGEPLVLFSGDAFNPSVMSTVTRGRQMPPVLNHMGIHAACYGNHDFDFGLDALLRLKDACTFPWLLSNVLDAHDAGGGQLADGLRTHVLEVPGGGGGGALRVGVMGLVENEWLVTLATLDKDDVVYEDFVVCARRLAAELRAPPHNVDLVVALTHMRVPNDVRLAAEAGDVLDLILGGHDHHYECRVTEPHGVLLCKSGTDFRELTVIDLAVGGSVPAAAAATASPPLRQPLAAAATAAEAFPPLVPADFQVPERHTTADFIFRMLSTADLDADYAAVMSSIEPLTHVFAAQDEWPWATMTKEDDAKDLRRHQREFELRLAFAYTVFDPADKTCLGCFYINPPSKAGFDAELIFWVRQDCAAVTASATPHAVLEPRLGDEIRAWLAAEWPCLPRICWAGRFEHSWAAMEAMPWRDMEVRRVAHDGTTVVRYNARASGLALAAPSPGGYVLPTATLPPIEATAAGTAGAADGAAAEVGAAARGGAFAATGHIARGVEVLSHTRWEVTRGLPEHAETAALVARFEEQVMANMEKVVGVTACDLECRFERIRAEETNIGNFVADSVRHACSMAVSANGGMAVDVVLINSGTLRADKVIAAGPVRVGDLMALLPMCDAMVVVRVTAAQLLSCLENGVSQWPRLEGRWPCLSGVAFEFDGAAPPGQRVVVDSVTVAREPLDFGLDEDSGMPRTYTLATKEYLAKGKDGYDCLAACPVVVEDEVLPPLGTMIRQHFKAIDVANDYKAMQPPSPPQSGLRRTASADMISQRWAARVEQHFDMTKCESPRSACATKQALGIHPVVDGRIRRREKSGGSGSAERRASSGMAPGLTALGAGLRVHIPESPERRAARAPSFDGADLHL